MKALLAVGLVGFAGLLLYGYARNHPQDLPWTPLDLTQPVGIFTGRKLAGLEGEAEHCRALLARAGIRFAALPPRSAGQQCGFDDAVRFRSGGALQIGYRPADLATSCPVAAALALWEWHVVQPAALEHFRQPVEAIWSEHATANAVDIAAFRLDDGTRISVLSDWDGEGRRAAFLRQVRSGACDLFATVLSPDYNEAHRDHLHLDQAARGEMGWRGCR